MCHDVYGYNISKSFISTWLKEEKVEVGNAVMNEINTIFDKCDTQDANGKVVKGGDQHLNKKERNVFFKMIDNIIQNLLDNSDEDTDDSYMAAQTFRPVQEALHSLRDIIYRFENGIATEDDHKKFSEVEQKEKAQKDYEDTQKDAEKLRKNDPPIKLNPITPAEPLK